MNDSNTHINDLLSAFCSGKITDGELITLHSWIQESEENQKQADDFLRLYRNIRAYDAFDKIDNGKALKQVLSRVQKIKKRRRIIFFRTAAAVAVILIGSAFAVNWYMNDFNVEEPIHVVEIVEPGEAKATLILADGREIDLENVEDSMITDAGGANIEKRKEIIDYRESKVEEEIFNTIKIPRGGEYTLVLSDGSKVVLNADSELTYPVKFLANNRVIKLKGEAYLEVTEDTQHPFIVETELANVKVLGTSFNVKAYEEDTNVEATLVSGKVSYYKPEQDEHSVILHPGNQALIDEESGEIVVRDVDTYSYTAWKDGLFIFENKTLPEIFTVLGRWYDVDVNFESSVLRSLHFTGDLERYETINTHLEMIELTTNVEFEIKDKKVYVKSKN